MLLETNGIYSSSKRTKHINVRYFFIQDRIQKGEMDVKYCPTDDMIADFFTKPLQGAKFIKFRNMIMGTNWGHQWCTGVCWKVNNLHVIWELSATEMRLRVFTYYWVTKIEWERKSKKQADNHYFVFKSSWMALWLQWL